MENATRRSSQPEVLKSLLTPNLLCYEDEIDASILDALFVSMGIDFEMEIIYVILLLCGPGFEHYFIDEMLVTQGSLRHDCNGIEWVHEAIFGAKVAKVNGLYSTCVRPKEFKGRFPNETWTMWLCPKIGRSGSWYHRFLQIREDWLWLWMDLFGQGRQLAVMDSNHGMMKTSAKTEKGSFIDDKWRHYAISFSETGECKVFMDGELVSTCEMDAPVVGMSRPELAFGNTDKSDGGSSSSYGFIGKVFDVRHYRYCVKDNKVKEMFNEFSKNMGEKTDSKKN